MRHRSLVLFCVLIGLIFPRIASANGTQTQRLFSSLPRNNPHGNYRRKVLARRANANKRTLGERTSTAIRRQLAQTTVEESSNAAADYRARISRNHFNTERDLSIYIEHLGVGFASRLRSLGPQHHWIDMGAGHAFAVRQYLSERPQGERAQVTALAAVRPEGVADDERYRYLHGRLLSDFSAEEIGQADLITDFFGPAFYGHFDETIEQYGHLLREGGEAWIIVGQHNPSAQVEVNGVRMRGTGAFYTQERKARHELGPETQAAGWRTQRNLLRRWIAASSGFDLIEVTETGTIGLRRNGDPIRMAPMRLSAIRDDERGLLRRYRFTPSHDSADARRHGNE